MNKWIAVIWDALYIILLVVFSILLCTKTGAGTLAITFFVLACATVVRCLEARDVCSRRKNKMVLLKKRREEGRKN